MEAQRLSGTKRDFPDSSNGRETEDLLIKMRSELDGRLDVVCDRKVFTGTVYIETIEKWSFTYDSSVKNREKQKVVEAARIEILNAGCRFYTHLGKRGSEAVYQEVRDEKCIKTRIQRNLQKHARKAKNALIETIIGDILPMPTDENSVTAKVGASRPLLTPEDFLRKSVGTSGTPVSMAQPLADAEHFQAPPPPLLERKTTYNPIPFHDYKTAPNPNSSAFSQTAAADMDFWLTPLRESESEDPKFVSPETVPKNPSNTTKAAERKAPPTEMSEKTSDWSTVLQKTDLQPFDGTKRVFQDDAQSETAAKLPMSAHEKNRELEMKVSDSFLGDNWLSQQMGMQQPQKVAKLAHRTSLDFEGPVNPSTNQDQSHEGTVTAIQDYQDGSSQWSEAVQPNVTEPSQDVVGVSTKERQFEDAMQPANGANHGQNNDETVKTIQEYQGKSHWSTGLQASAKQHSHNDAGKAFDATKGSPVEFILQPAKAANQEVAHALATNENWSTASQQSGMQSFQDAKLPPKPKESRDEAAKVAAPIPANANPEASRQYLARIDALEQRVKTLMQDNRQFRERVEKMEHQMLAQENRHLRERIKTLEGQDNDNDTTKW